MYIKATITSSTDHIAFTHQATRDGWHWQILHGGIQSPYSVHWDDQANQDIEWIDFRADKWSEPRIINSQKWRNK